MNSFNWVLVISIIFLVLVLWFFKNKHKWKFDELANIFTVYGVMIGTAALLCISHVYIVQKPEVKLSSFTIEDVKTEEYILDESEIKPFGNYIDLEHIYKRSLLISGYIINNGNAVASDLEFHYKILADDLTNRKKDNKDIFGDNIKVGIFENTTSKGKIEISLVPEIVDDFWYSFTLPPINPDTSLSIKLLYNSLSYNTKESIKKKEFGKLLTDNKHFLLDYNEKYKMIEKYIKKDDEKVKKIDEEFEKILNEKISLQLLDNEENRAIKLLEPSSEKSLKGYKKKIFIIQVSDINVEDVIVEELQIK